MELQIHNIQRLKENLKTNIDSCQSIQQKIKMMDTKFTHKAIERLNKVALRDVQIKHTSEYTIHLGCQFYAQLKSVEAIQFLNRKKTKYLEDFKKVQIQLQILENQNSRLIKNGKFAQEVNEKFSTSSMEVIGKNQMGEDIFNIVQMQGEEDIAKWQSQKLPAQKVQVRSNLVNQLQRVSQQKTQAKNGGSTLLQLKQQIKQESDQNMEDDKISDSDEDDQEDQGNGQDDLIHFNRLKLEDQLNFNFKEDPQMKNINKIKNKLQQQKQQNNTAPRVNFAKEEFNKEQAKKIKQEQPKKISKFKMQRLKQRQ